MADTERNRTTPSAVATDLAPLPLLRTPGPHRPADFSGGSRIGDFVVLSWETALGTIGLAYSVTGADTGDSGGALRAGEELSAAHWGHVHKVYDCLVTVGPDVHLDRAPRLEAIDVLSDGRFSPVYDLTWMQLALVLSGKAPWFHQYLREPAAILEWRPGYPPALVAADDPDLPTAPLALLALDEPDGSPAAAVCTYLAKCLRRRAAEHAAEAISHLTGDEYGPEEDRAFVGIGALPALFGRRDEQEESEEPEQMVKLAGWVQITERRDTLAEAVASTVLRWDGGKDWPHGESIELYPDRCPIAAEWVEALEPAPGDMPPTVAERRLLSGRRDHEDPLLLHDLATAAPAVGHTDDRGELTVTATCPQRIPSLAPLAEVILSHGTVWIRTDDGRLWLAPNISGIDLSLTDSGSHGGSGPAALTNLLDKLLDDITAPAVRNHGTPPQGLRKLIEATPRQGTTRYDRARLLTARQR
jgi:hypothetical protein